MLKAVSYTLVFICFLITLSTSYLYIFYKEMIRLGFGLGLFYLVIGYTLYYWISFVFWIFHKVISHKKQNLKTFYIIPLASFFFFLSSSTSFNIFRLLFHIWLTFTLVSQFKVPYPWNSYQFLCCKHSLFWFSSRQLIPL